MSILKFMVLQLIGPCDYGCRVRLGLALESIIHVIYCNLFSCGFKTQEQEVSKIFQFYEPPHIALLTKKRRKFILLRYEFEFPFKKSITIHVCFKATQMRKMNVKHWNMS
jgi:hypothetical protein